MSLYHTWFLIEPILENDHRDLCEVFDRSMYDVARQYEATKACITIVRETDKLRNQVFPQQASEADKVNRYECLIQSHNQHLQLCQTLFEQLRNPDGRLERKKEKIEALRIEREAVKAENQQLRKQMEELQTRHRIANERIKEENDRISERNSRLLEKMSKMSEEFELLSHTQSDAPQEIVDNLTREANQRIDKANQTINQLRTVIGDKTGEVELHREEARIARENAQEKEREVALITEQKKELLRIVEKLYNNQQIRGPDKPPTALQPTNGGSDLMLPNPNDIPA